MGNWSGIQNALASVQPAQGRIGALASTISKVAERLRAERQAQAELGQKKNLLGYAGLMEGKIEKAQEGEQGAMNVPGVGWVKKAQSDEMAILNKIMGDSAGTQGQGVDGQGKPQGIENIMGQNTGQKWQMNKIDLGPVTMERQPTPQEEAGALSKKVKEKQTLTLAEGIPPSEAGKTALATESIKNIQDVKKLLFPTGTKESFKRSTAFASNVPGGSLPILPSRFWGKAEQDVFRKMGAALSGRQLIQTGVAARPEETQKLISQFAPSGGSNPEAALNGLNELEAFYKDYLNNLTTRGIKSPVQSGNKQGGQLKQDSQGNKAMVYPDGSFEEVP